MSATIAAAVAGSSAAGNAVKNNGTFKIVGISLAIGSGLFIGTSFVVKKKGLLSATAKYGNATGEGHGYLKSWLWWTGMIMMIVGEICNFVAYAFTEAILVTPLGALSVVICAVLSHFFLKETLTFFGWIGCTLCIIGATILALNAPEQQSVTTIHEFQKLFLSPGFLVWASLCIAASLVVVFYVAPRWGKKNMMPYISVCSLIGGISVSCTQGLGASIVTSIQGNNQVRNAFFWILFVFVVITLLVEINYLNKALELFNTSMVVPVYFCYFSSATLITSFILYQGLKASAVTLITMVLGFLVICLGITLLQLSKVDPTQLSKLDRKTTILLQASRHETEYAEKGQVTSYEDPGMDALRGGFGAVGSIIRARSVSRRMSTASGFGGRGYDSHGNLTTRGMGNVQRYQLSDTPMRSESEDHIAPHAPPPTRSGSFNQPLPRSQSITFEEADVVHQYGYGREDDAIHQYRSHHPHSAPPLSVTTNTSKGGFDDPSAVRSSTGILAYPPSTWDIPEEDEDVKVMSASIEKSGRHYHDPYPAPQSARAMSPRSPSTGRQVFNNLFHFGHSADPSRQSSKDVRSGSNRGGKDYPHVPKKNYAMEREERAALVRDDEDGYKSEDEDKKGLYDEDLKKDSFEEEPKSAVTEESMGHVHFAERRPAPSAPPSPVMEERRGGIGVPPLPLPPGAMASAMSRGEKVDGPRGPRESR